MSTFRFAIMGAGNIAHQFCDAVTLVEDCEVSAIASKDLGRAQKFAEECSVAHAYDNYEQMLIEEKPDCVYIAVTPNDHFRLTMLCLEHHVPVLCEKAMFTNSAEAKAVFEKAEKDQTFVMEAMWSRFLPAVNQVKKWAAEGKIGRLHRYFYTTVGNGTSVANSKRFAAEFAQELRNDGVDAVILTST